MREFIDSCFDHSCEDKSLLSDDDSVKKHVGYGCFKCKKTWRLDAKLIYYPKEGDVKITPSFFKSAEGRAALANEMSESNGFVKDP